MSGGNYNDNGRKPTYLSAMELNMLGWMDYPEELSAGSYTLEPIRNYKAYQCQSIVDGEYFIIEARDNYKWDSAIGPGGLIIYHVDKSYRIVGDGMTAAQLWSGNKINAYFGHPCYDFVASGDKKYTFGSSGNAKNISLTDWDDNEIGVMLSGISYSGDNTSFTVTISDEVVVLGHVYDSFGQPLEGATVSISQSLYAFAAPAFLSVKLSEEDAVGARVQSITFAYAAADAEKVYVVLEMGDQRVLQREVTSYAPSQYITVDVEDAGISIPADTDIIVGYGFSGNTLCKPLRSPSDADNSDGTILNVGFLNDMDWGGVSWNGGSDYFNFVIGLNLTKSVEPAINHFDVAYIKVANNLPIIVPQASKSVYSTEWFLDGVAVEGPDMLTNIAEGKHTYMVYLSYYDGTEERVYYDFTR